MPQPEQPSEDTEGGMPSLDKTVPTPQEVAQSLLGSVVFWALISGFVVVVILVSLLVYLRRR
ncbi:hypothetical protein HY496_02115 [Candidatus Woesearchaeota archaeon]|nr:hypothetical protein [Candidatus Woesearchaeota archaeon]